jgi:hypothetical protein
MAVLLTISETLTGSGLADALAGGGTGLDLGNVINSQYAPITSQPANTGAQEVYISHDAVVDNISQVRTYVAQFGSGTGFSYGGANSAAADIAKLLNMGDGSSSSVANNGDGLANGLHIDMDWQVSTVNQFNPSRIGTGQVRIYGDNGGAASGDGRNEATAFTLNADAMSRNNAGTEVDATTPVAGSIGKAGDAVLGDRGHLKMRFFLADAETDGGILQWEWVTAYAYTALVFLCFSNGIFNYLLQY